MTKSKLRTLAISATLAAGTALGTAVAVAGTNPMVGGAEM
jgi:hypothetical protein